MDKVVDHDHRIHWAVSLPFFGVHLVALAALVVPFHWAYVGVAVGLYYLRMFGITAGYHRYFAHRTFKTSRVFQFLLAWLGASSAQKGVLWWSAHHRNHHKYSDLPGDAHSPVREGFWWSHVGWILAPRYEETEWDRVTDLSKFAELRWLNRYHLVPPFVLALGLLLIGGWPLMIWGFFVSTVLLWHGTFTINSLSHVFGSRRYQTTDDSRNNVVLALLTMGEGWHNNHHHYMSSVNQGFYWWEIDMSYYILRLLERLGLVWDLRTPPQSVLVLRQAQDERLAIARWWTSG